MGEAKKHVEEILKLAPDERSAAAEALLISLEDEPEQGIEQAWAEEIQRRIAANEPGIPADSVFAEARARLKNRP